ncbi:MAG: hypothetical protein ACP5I8_10500 [Phycisphaerae bacterium]
MIVLRFMGAGCGFSTVKCSHVNTAKFLDFRWGAVFSAGKSKSDKVIISRGVTVFSRQNSSLEFYIEPDVVKLRLAFCFMVDQLSAKKKSASVQQRVVLILPEADTGDKTIVELCRTMSAAK